MTTGNFYRLIENATISQWSGNVEAFIANESKDYQAVTSCTFAKAMEDDKMGVLFTPHKMNPTLTFGGGIFFIAR